MFGKLGIGTPAIIFLKKYWLAACIFFFLQLCIWVVCLLIVIFVFLVFEIFFSSFRSMGIDPHLACGWWKFSHSTCCLFTWAFVPWLGGHFWDLVITENISLEITPCSSAYKWSREAALVKLYPLDQIIKLETFMKLLSVIL